MNTHNTGHTQQGQQPDGQSDVRPKPSNQDEAHSTFIAQTEKLVGLLNPETAEQDIERGMIEDEIVQMFQWLSTLDPVKDNLLLTAHVGCDGEIFWGRNSDFWTGCRHWGWIREWVQSCVKLHALIVLSKGSESPTGELHITLMAMQNWGGNWESLSPELIKMLPEDGPSAFRWIEGIKNEATYARIEEVYPDCPCLGRP